MRGFESHFCEAGEEGGEGGDVPALPPRAQHIPRAQIQNQHRAAHGYDVVERLHCVFPEIRRNSAFFVVAQPHLVSGVSVLFAAVDPIGHGVGDTVHCGPV